MRVSLARLFAYFIQAPSVSLELITSELLRSDTDRKNALHKVSFMANRAAYKCFLPQPHWLSRRVNTEKRVLNARIIHYGTFKSRS